MSVEAVKEVNNLNNIDNIYTDNNMNIALPENIYDNRGKITKKIYRFFKRVFDIVGSLVGIIILGIPMIIVALLIFLQDGGCPVYSHTRLGKDGKPFELLKFRSMAVDPEPLEEILTEEQIEQYRKEYKIDNDPRITPLGNILRKTSIDELPQMFNILKGDMSVIGPRPIVEDEIEYYGKDKERFLSVQPGLTGYWQAYARNNAGYESGQRQQMEMYYINNQSLWLDIKIFFKTIVSVIRKDGAQ